MLTTDRDGQVQDAPPLGDELAQDPTLAALKLVAWAADDSLLPRAGERGFPHWGRWAERNKRFTKDVVQWFAQGARGCAGPCQGHLQKVTYRSRVITASRVG